MSFTPEELNKLKEIVEATNTNVVAYAMPYKVQNLVAAGLVETNVQMTNPQGQVASRATAAGIAFVNSGGAGAAPAAATPATPRAPLQIIANGGLPPVRRTGGGNKGSTLYPFEAMEVNSLLFVEATEKRPNPAKSLASTITSANKRFADFQPQRRFIVRRIAAGEKAGEFVAPKEGAVIVRVDPVANPPRAPRTKKEKAAEGASAPASA